MYMENWKQQKISESKNQFDFIENCFHNRQKSRNSKWKKEVPNIIMWPNFTKEKCKMVRAEYVIVIFSFMLLCIFQIFSPTQCWELFHVYKFQGPWELPVLVNNVFPHRNRMMPQSEDWTWQLGGVRDQGSATHLGCKAWDPRTVLVLPEPSLSC